MQTANHLIGLPKRAKLENRFNFLTLIDEEPLLTRLYKAAAATGIADLLGRTDLFGFNLNSADLIRCGRRFPKLP